MRIPRPAALRHLLISVFGSLFWRTFMLIALLIAISLGVWFQSFRIFEREPRAQQIAMQVVSVVKLTRAALLYSDPSRRRFLLLDLVQNEGIKVYPREKEDEYREPHTNPYLTQLVQQEIRNRLGADAVIATAVNDIPGVWVSFQIEGDDYWVAISPDRFEHVPGLQWLWWSMAALVLSVLGAAFITSRVNQPLKRLADTARAISAGEDPKALPEGGGTEVAQANHSFNQMVRDLKQLEADRAVMLAGISHDLRTPLTRLRLETEMSPVDEQTRELMVADIEQMDAIIGQFLDYARPSGEMLEDVDLTELVRDTAPVYSAHDDIDLTLKLAPEAIARCNRMETQRILDNLIENARRYGKTPARTAQRSPSARSCKATRLYCAWPIAVQVCRPTSLHCSPGRSTVLNRHAAKPRAPGWACRSSIASYSAAAAASCLRTAHRPKRDCSSAPATRAPDPAHCAASPGHIPCFPRLSCVADKVRRRAALWLALRISIGRF